MSSPAADSVIRVNSVTTLESLVGAHVTGEEPEVYWADSHGYFQFPTEAEAKAAVNDPYCQQFLPLVDWSKTVVEEIRVYRPYCSECAAVWQLVGRASEKHGPLSIARKQGRWWAAFGRNATKDARMAPVAICLAALEAAGIRVEIDQDRIDSELVRPSGPDGLPGKVDDEKPA